MSNQLHKWRKVLNRSQRLTRLIELAAPEHIMQYEVGQLLAEFFELIADEVTDDG